MNNKYLTRADVIKKIEAEGNSKVWTHRDLTCIISRYRPLGHLCGYVGVDKNSVFYKQDCFRNYDLFRNIEVHGGLTFSDFFEPDNEFCAIVPPDLWFIGFDCAHYGDYSCGLSLGIEEPRAYRDIEYVIAETESLAEQLAEFEITVNKKSKE